MVVCFQIKVLKTIIYMHIKLYYKSRNGKSMQYLHASSLVLSQAIITLISDKKKMHGQETYLADRMGNCLYINV